MENESFFDNQIEEELQLTEESINYLKEAAKWAKFLSILGFVSVGIVAITLFFIVVLYSLPGPSHALTRVTVVISCLVIGVIIFIPVYLMYKFASKTLKAIETNNTEILSKGLSSFKSYFKFNGILIIVVLSFYILLFIKYIATYIVFSVSNL